MPETGSEFEALLEAAPDAIVGVARDGRITLVSRQAEVLFGYARAELLGRPVEVLVPESARKIHLRHRESYFGEPVTRPIGAGMELAGRRKDGSEFPAEISMSSIDTPDGVVALAAIRDGTERKQAAIIASSSDAIISMTLDGIVTSWNPGAARLYGLAARAMLGRSRRVLIPAERWDEERDLRRRVSHGELVAEYETLGVRADSSLVQIASTMSPIMDASGAVVGISTISRDITERKRVEAERQTLQERLQQSQRLDSLGQLAGGIAHDFNNLLAVILNYASFVAEEVAADTAVRADVEQIRIAAERAARLTQQLLVFARRETIELKVLDLNTIVAETHTLLSRTIGEHVQLVVSAASELPAIRADRGQMEQVLLNLAVNARDAMPFGGTLTIETAESIVDEEYARFHGDLRPGRYVTLSVSDTGGGMSEEVMARAFEPFFSTKPKDKGTGLGLATLYGIVTESGGGVTLYSEGGLGTTVRVHLPAVAETADPVSARAQDEPPPGQGEVILVVEDEEAMLQVTARILRHHGYIVLEARSSVEALELAEAERFDLLLTDVIMPGLSGRELAERLQARLAHLAVLFMSGYSQGVLGPERVLDEGVALIQKPFDQRTLLERVKRVLADRASECVGSGS